MPTPDLPKPTNNVPALPVSKAFIIVGSVLAGVLIIIAFIAGYLTGHGFSKKDLERTTFAHRQLTENLDRPIKDRPLLQNIPADIKERFKEHGLRGTIIEAESDVLVIDTKEGAHKIQVTPETKIVKGQERQPGNLEDLKAGTEILVLSRPDGEPEGAVLIVINPGDEPFKGRNPEGSGPRGPQKPF